MAEPSIDGSPPWADIPVEMVDAVVEHLDVFSATRVAGVCSSWAAAVATNPALPFGTPCLLMMAEDGDYEEEEEEDTFQLMDLTRGEREVSLPALVWGAREQWWVGGKDDWLATVDERGDARLVNPYSGRRIDLPDISPVAAKTRDTFGRIVVCDTPFDTAVGIDWYLVIAVVPTPAPGLLAIAAGGGGPGSWTALRNPGGNLFGYSDAVVHKRKVFAVDTSGSVHTWDIRGGVNDVEPTELSQPPQLDVDPDDEFERRWRLAESADGRRLILVCTYGREINCAKSSGYRRSTFEYTGFQAVGVRLYERDVDDADDGWSPVLSLGDHSLFLGANCPFLAPIVNRDSSSDAKCHQLRPNCVCITDNQLFRSQETDTDMEMFDLGEENFEKYPYRSRKLFHSNRYNSFQTPMWFRPTLKSYELE
ncbi:hypothetical protein EJB05_30808, partial [Eragrostis curvula]